MKQLVSVLKQDSVDIQLIMLIKTILVATKEIAFRVNQGALAGVLGSTLDHNVQGEVQKKLDVLSNQILKDALLGDATVRTLASEEEDSVVGGNLDGNYIVAFDPLDGSSNIDINGQIGTIFTIYNARYDVPFDSELQFSQKGNQQVCAGYVLYGASTLLVMTTGGPTRCYTLDSTTGEFLLTVEQMLVPAKSKEFAVNMANYRYWDLHTKKLFDDVLSKSDHFIGASMRWNAAMVGDMHRIITRGGVFVYPADSRQGVEHGKIRLLYEANPLALLIEKASGSAITKNNCSILEIQPTSLHQRVPVYLGSSELVSYFYTTK